MPLYPRTLDLFETQIRYIVSELPKDLSMGSQAAGASLG